MRHRKALLVAVFLAGYLIAPAARAADTPSLFEVVINGTDTGQICMFQNRDGQLWANAADLGRLGFILPRAISGRPGAVVLFQLRGVVFHVDIQRQIIDFTASNAALRPQILDAQSQLAQPALSPAGWGLVLNYDSLFTSANNKDRYDGANSGGALLDLRGLSPYGVFDSTTQYQLNPQRGEDSWQRLDNTYTYSDEPALRRWRAGDIISGALSWSRAVRLAGIQIGTDFALRPDLITYPLPQFSGAAAVPSTVDLLIDGDRVFSQNVQSGPFQVATLPRVDGAGDAVVTVTNAVGQQVTTTVPFYITPSLLLAGLSAYSFEAGAVRTDYATRYDHYQGLGWSGSFRHGLTDWLTLEAHAEGTQSLGLGGGGLAMRVGEVGVLSLSAAGSAGGAAAFQGGFAGAPETTMQAKAGAGASASIGFRRQTTRYNVAISASHATAGYRDIAALYGAAMPHDTVTANFGLSLGRAGALDAAYIGQTAWPGANQAYGQEFYGQSLSGDRRGIDLAEGLFGAASRISQINLSYSVKLIGPTSFYASGYKDLEHPRAFALTLGLTGYFGGVSAYAADELQNGVASPQFSAQKPVIAPGDWGFYANDTEGPQVYRTADLNYLSGWGKATAGVAQTPYASAGRAGLQGALVLIDGGLFAADRVDDSFAVVSSGNVPHVRVTYENRAAGMTNSSGLLLVPELQSYNRNLLALDPDDLPPDVAVRTTQLVLRPQNQSYVYADFGVRYDNPAVLRLVLPNGTPLPMGSLLTLASGPPIIVGYGGQAYATGLVPHNHATVALADGKTCSLIFDFHPKRDDIQTIGPLPCD